ncbi:MAG TPA: alpha/beta hydrolase [Ktedonobacterales bacterium]|nr:alpha/beta hydrolase [Ktedonobacterales bacterium]
MVATRSNENTIGPTGSIPNPRTYVLLHGAWHDGSAWKDVRAELELAGHPVQTPTLAGHGPAAQTRHVPRAQMAAPLIDTLIEHELREVVLVAHSFAGLIAPLVVEAVPERIAHLVFLDALIPVAGQDAFYGTPMDHPVPLEHQADGTVSLSLETWLSRFWRDEQAHSALAAPERGEAVWRTRLSPQSLAAALEPAHLSRFHQLREAGLPTTYLRCRGDVVFGDPDFWQAMVDRLPNCRVVELDGGHEVLFTRPTELANALIAATQAPQAVPVAVSEGGNTR